MPSGSSTPLNSLGEPGTLAEAAAGTAYALTSLLKAHTVSLRYGSLDLEDGHVAEEVERALTTLTKVLGMFIEPPDSSEPI